jgi:catechol 2,3-dioxygenase-like lactoylglutathione lyase family enzyme
MANLRTVEIKAFVPARDFAVSRHFYQDLGFTLASDAHGVAYFHCGACSFLLQQYDAPGFAEQFVMHLLVENLADRYGVALGMPEDQPWRMRDFVLKDPSGVLWRIAQNIGGPVSDASDVPTA